MNVKILPVLSRTHGIFGYGSTVYAYQVIAYQLLNSFDVFICFPVILISKSSLPDCTSSLAKATDSAESTKFLGVRICLMVMVLY